MFNISQRFWAIVVAGSALLFLGAGCGRNELLTYGGTGVAGSGNVGNFGATGGRGGSGAVGNSGGTGNVGAVGNGAGVGNFGGSSGFCGDGVCGPLENMDKCLGDCHPLCHDGLCNLQYDPKVCPEDCATCGNNFCDNGPDQFNGCGFECVCGNGHCDAQVMENPTTCPQDCRACNFNNYCDAGETT